MIAFRWCCVMVALLMVVGLGQELQEPDFEETHLKQRQEDLATPTPFNLSSGTPMSSNSSSFLSVVSDYWYVCLVVVVLVVVGVVFLCASVLRKKRRQERLQISQSQLQSIEGDGAACEPSIRGNSSPGMLDSAGGSPGNLSIGQSPIPSPQPSFSSSHKSMRSSGRGSARRKRRNHSPGHTSSGSEDTIRPYQCYSMSSLASSVSTIGPHNTRVHRTESFSSGRGSERGYGSERRGSEMAEDSRYKSATPQQVKVVGVSDESPLHSAPSTLSINSSHSHSSQSRASHLARRRTTPTPGLIKVDVKVHLEQDNTAPFQIAAALAESARQLAQSAANFEQEDSLAGPYHPHHHPSLHHPSLHHSRISLSSSRPSSSSYHHTPSRRKLFTNHSSSAVLQGHHPAPLPLPLVSLDRPGHTLNLDKPKPTTTPHHLSHSLSRTGMGEGREWTRRNSTSSYRSFNSDSVLPLGQSATQRQHLAQQGGKLALTEDESTPSRGGSRLSTRQFSPQSDHGSKDSNTTTQKPAPPVDSSSAAVRKKPNHSLSIEENVVAAKSPYTPPHLPPQVKGEDGARQELPPSGQQPDGEVPSPHSSSQPSLSRSGSALSLDPQLSSTASGYAATGSSSSLDTLSKATPPAADSASDSRLQQQDVHTVHGKDGFTLVSPCALSAHLPHPHRPGYPLAAPLAPNTATLGYPLPPLTTYHHQTTGDHMIYSQDHMTNPIFQSTGETGFRQRSAPDHTHNYTYPHHVGLPPLPSHPSDSITIDV